MTRKFKMTRKFDKRLAVLGLTIALLATTIARPTTAQDGMTVTLLEGESTDKKLNCNDPRTQTATMTVADAGSITVANPAVASATLIDPNGNDGKGSPIDKGLVESPTIRITGNKVGRTTVTINLSCPEVFIDTHGIGLGKHQWQPVTITVIVRKRPNVPTEGGGAKGGGGKGDGKGNHGDGKGKGGKPTTGSDVPTYDPRFYEYKDGKLVPRLDAPRREQSQPNSTPSATLSGVVTVALDTSMGKLNLTLPADIRAGDTISGTVDEDSARRAEVLSGSVFDVAGQQCRLRDRVLTFGVPAGFATLPIILRNSSGHEMARSQVQVNRNAQQSTVPSHPGGERPIVPPRPNNYPPTPLGNFHPPRLVQAGHELLIPGNFDGDANTTKVSIGDLVAESPRCAFLKVPADAPTGPATLTIEKALNVPGQTEAQTVREQFKFNVLSVNLAADKLHLRRGETTQLHVTVKGLSGLDDYKGKINLELKNLSPNVVRFNSTPAQELVKGIYSDSQYQRNTINGTFTLNEQLTGIDVGEFTINATVLCSLGCEDECKLSDPDKNRTEEVKLDFVKYSEGQVQPIYDVKVRVCCDKCMVETCWVYWTQNKWRRKCTGWKTLFQVMMTDKDNWQNITYPTKSYKSSDDVKAAAKKEAEKIPCPTGLASSDTDG